MAHDHFLNIDIKKLFEEHTIKEIEVIQKKIQNESDRKKIELRTLVGERYRDLIQAADTIAEMKQTSESVVKKIKKIEETFHTLQQKYLIGFKMDLEPENVEKDNKQISDSVIIQIKVLMEIPEQIWSSIDSKNFLLATQLFMLAQHINYSLRFEVGESELVNKYPIVTKQWEIINQIKSLIHNFCDDTLQLIDLDDKLAANCLAALVLIDGLNSSELLSRLISSKSSTIKSTITKDSELNVKSRIKLSLKILLDTIPLISTCFIRHKDQEEGLVSLYINNINDMNALQMLSQLDVNKDLLNDFLPSVAKNHKLFIQSKLEKLSLENIQECVKNWFKWIKDMSSVEIKKLLGLIVSVKGICNIRDECLAVKVPENWNSIWESYCLPSFNFWMEFFQPLLTQRIKDIVSNKLSLSLTNLKSNVSDLIKKLVMESYEYPEKDLRWFVWKDSPSDIPQNLMHGSINSNRPLLMKARGFSPNIVELCNNFEKDLEEFLAHLKQYLYESEPTSTIKDDILVSDIYLASNKFCDRVEIQEYLQQCSRSLIDNFIKYAKENFIRENPKFGGQDINSIVIGRFLQAVPVLCLNFKECFTLSRSTGLTLTNIKWEEVCDILKQESTFMWSIWAQTFTKIIPKLQEEVLIIETINNFRINSIITDWEKVVIEEVAEEGKKINSEILVPYQSSVHLQKFLASVCKELNKIVPHTIPKIILNQIIEKIVSELLEYYDKFYTGEDIRQKQAIQILFDIKFISLMMLSRDNKILVEKSNKVSNKIISKIDPFDFDVFYPFINNNVKKTTQRSLLIYGNLVPDMEYLLSVLGSRIEHGNGLKSIKDPPGVLALCTGTPWFPPLAVINPVKIPIAPTSVSEKPQSKKKASTKDHNRADSTGSSIKSGAAAFFGAMGTDWFGGS